VLCSKVPKVAAGGLDVALYALQFVFSSGLVHDLSVSAGGCTARDHKPTCSIVLQ
jgi:hypothetical protein